MIFCFSGTGNSLHVAKRVSKETNDEIIMITESERQLSKKYILKEEEMLGFVFPIYWWGMPILVEKFIKQLDIEIHKGKYVYAIVTFGLGANNGVKDLKRLLAAKNISLDANFEVKMVDNYIVGYKLAAPERQKEILGEASGKIEQIISVIRKKSSAEVKDYIGSTVKPIVHTFYKAIDHSKKFHVTDTCTGCGTCARECPGHAIVIEDSRPMWVANCSFCLKCIHNCPKQAVQYGRGMEDRTRYCFEKIGEGDFLG